MAYLGIKVYIMKRLSYSPVRTAQKTLRLLETLSEIQPARPSELAKRLNLSRSNCYRLLSTLQEMGYVERTDDARYRLGFKLFVIGNTVRDENRLSHVARPALAHLAEMSHENVNLAIMYEWKALYVDKIERPHYLKLDQPIGKTDPLHCTALGKVLLSGLNDDELEVFLRTEQLISYTKQTITDPKVLVSEIKNVRRQGYALDLEELRDGIHCIAAPICDYTKRVVAAISISAPSVRLTAKKLEETKAPLIQAAAEVSKKLGMIREEDGLWHD